MSGWKLALVLPLLVTAPVLAQAPGARSTEPNDTTPPCVDVRIGNEPTYNCANAQLGRVIPQRRFGAGSEMPVAASLGPAGGVFDQAAVAEQFGTAFGKSARPQRPPPETFSPPLPVRR